MIQKWQDAYLEDLNRASDLTESMQLLMLWVGKGI